MTSSIVLEPRLLHLEQCERDLAALLRPRPIAEYHEDMGAVLWWCWEKVTGPTGHVSYRWRGEPPYCGSPNDLGYEVIIQPSIALHIATSESAEDKDDPSFDLVAEVPKRFMVGGWPGYHTHWSPLPKVDLP